MSAYSRVRRIVKDALDDLPCGICFFSGPGVPVLYNHTMYRLIFDLTDRDLQSLSELRGVLAERAGKEEGGTCVLPDGSAWRFALSPVTDSAGDSFTQAIAYDVTDLYRGAREMEANVEQLKEISAYIRSITENVAALTREEELLSMKMQVHDRLGSSLLKLRRYVLERGGADKEALLADWRRSVTLLQHELGDDEPAADPYAELVQSTAAIGVEVVLTGELPRENLPRQLITHALRQCITNAVRHAGSSKVYMDVSRDGDTVRAAITNDGLPPEREVREGGGLTSLRSRLAAAGGTLEIHSFPRFELTAVVPVKRGLDV